MPLTHAAIDCMLFLKDQFDINPEEITEIECIVYPKCLDIAARAEPKTGWLKNYWTKTMWR